MEEKRDTGGFNLSKLKCLTSSDLKLVALCTMTIDHIGAVLLPQYLILRIIGRIAFPIYCFLIVNGLFHTRDCKKYIGRLLLFALISEIFFDLAFFETIYEPEDQNVFFTLAIGLVMLYVIERIHNQPWIRIHFLKIVMELLVVIFCCFLAYVLRTDYSFYGILMMYGFYM
nr:conjugal transfer protein TraX [Lachnospiraceae bacterium]